MTVQCAQLNEANRLWQQYQENQSMILRERLHLPQTDDLSFEQLVHSIEQNLNQLQNERDLYARQASQSLGKCLFSEEVCDYCIPDVETLTSPWIRTLSKDLIEMISQN